MIKSKLNDIADIILGYPFRGKIPEKADADYSASPVNIVQIKDITKDTLNQPEKLTTAYIHSGYEKYRLQLNDLVMSVRGGNYVTKRITQLKEPTIAVSHVFIIRCSKKIQPAFLYWFLNQSRTQDELKKTQTGTNIPMLNKAALASLDVALPEISTQEKIASLQSLWAEQKQTYEQLIQNGNLLTQGLCKKLLES